MSAPDRERGSVLVEMALVVPVLFLFAFGLVDVGLLVFERTQAAAAARDGARAAIVDYDQADVPTSADNQRVAAAAVAHLDVAAPAVAVRCLNGAGGVIACANAVPQLDRVELTVSWDRSAVALVGGVLGRSRQVSATAAMVVSGTPRPAPSIPVTTAPLGGSTTTPTTTTTTTSNTTVTSTTVATVIGCTATLSTASPAVHSLSGSSGHLRTDLTVSVPTVGPCPAGIRVQLPTADGTVTLIAGGSGPAFTVVVDRNAYRWTPGTKTVAILDGAGGGVIGNAVFVITP